MKATTFGTAIILAMVAGGLAPAAAAPVQSKLGVDAVQSGVQAVQWRGHRHWRGDHGWRHRHRGWGQALGGLAAGAIIGGAIANSQAQADAVQYCSQRFRSYDPASGTYLGYDGMRHPCP